MFGCAPYTANGTECQCDIREYKHFSCHTVHYWGSKLSVVENEQICFNMHSNKVQLNFYSSRVSSPNLGWGSTNFFSCSKPFALVSIRDMSSLFPRLALFPAVGTFPSARCASAPNDRCKDRIPLTLDSWNLFVSLVSHSTNC
jgi:hypothetical protein